MMKAGIENSPIYLLDMKFLIKKNGSVFYINKFCNHLFFTPNKMIDYY